MNILKVFTKSRETGNIGEALAVRHLKKQGYRIIATNYCDYKYEIDIIAENETTLAFVEVKTRTSTSLGRIGDRPASAVTPEKQRKIIEAVNHYRSYNSIKKRISLDVVEVYLNENRMPEKILHIENAFNSNTAYTKRR